MGKATTKKIKNCVIVVFCYNCLLNALKNRARIKRCIFGLINTNDDVDKPTKSMEKVLFIQNILTVMPWTTFFHGLCLWQCFSLRFAKWFTFSRIKSNANLSFDHHTECSLSPRENYSSYSTENPFPMTAFYSHMSTKAIMHPFTHSTIV